MRAFLRELLQKNSGGFLIFVFLVALSVRVVFVLTREESLYFPDSEAYDAMAQRLGAGKGLALDERCKIARPPLYPIFLAGCYEVFGRRFWVVRIVQAVAGALTCVVVLLLGEETLDPVSARIGSIIAAFYPFSIFFCGLVLTETLFTLFLVLAIWLLAKARSPAGGGMLWAAGGGAAMGAAVLTRSSLVLFWAFLSPFWLIWLGGERKRAVQSLLLGLFVTGLVLSPWIIRNYGVTNGHFVPTTLQVGRSLYEANSPSATGGPAMHLIDWEAEKGGRNLSEYEENVYFRDKALAYMAQHPGRTLRLAVVKFLRFWNIIPNDTAYRGGLYVVISLFSYVPVMALGAFGLFKSRYDLRRCGLLLIPVAYFCLLHMVFVGSIRYRMPVMPFVILFAGGGARSVWWSSDEDGKEGK